MSVQWEKSKYRDESEWLWLGKELSISVDNMKLNDEEEGWFAFAFGRYFPKNPLFVPEDPSYGKIVRYSTKEEAKSETLKLVKEVLKQAIEEIEELQNAETK
jgi:hypothetical protein